MKLSELLDKPEKWTKGSSARDKNNKQVHPQEPEAVCWCLEGGLRCVTNGNRWSPWVETLRSTIIRLFPNRTDPLGVKIISTFNDHPDTTFEDIQKVIKEAGL